jgi:dienelactone hydrolase
MDTTRRGIAAGLGAFALLTGTLPVQAQQGASAPAAAPAESPADMAARMAAAQAVPDTAGDGPYPAMIEIDPALPGHVVYRPADLTRVGAGQLGLFVWGNGGCAADGTSSRHHLAQIASYGYLVIAPGAWRSGPNAKAKAEGPRVRGADGAMPPAPTSAADLTRALDWALAENARSGSRYAGKIDPAAVAAGGFSCGGVQAIEIAPDQRIKTLVVQNSGLFSDMSQAISGMQVPKEALQKIHTPVIYLQGGPTDIAFANGNDDFARINHVPAVMVNLPVGHGGTYDKPMGGKAASIVIDWLNWQLRGDASAGRTFAGANCRLCTDAEATLERKNLK